MSRSFVSLSRKKSRLYKERKKMDVELGKRTGRKEENERMLID